MVTREVQDHRVGPGREDLVDQPGVGAVKTVDRLVRVAHAEQVGVVARHLSQQHELQWIHVLGLVHVERAIAVAKRGQHVGLVTQDRDRLTQEQVEVHEAATLAEPDVAIEHVGQDGGRQRRLASQSPRVLRVERAVVTLTEGPTDLLF